MPPEREALFVAALPSAVKTTKTVCTTVTVGAPSAPTAVAAVLPPANEPTAPDTGGGVVCELGAEVATFGKLTKDADGLTAAEMEGAVLPRAEVLADGATPPNTEPVGAALAAEPDVEVSAKDTWLGRLADAG